MKRVQIIIKGMVTGVFYRRFVKTNADKLGVKGYVKNLIEDVEARFEGNDSDVDKLIELCKKGPDGAKVDNVEVREEKYRKEFEEFEIII